jgi:hypothetical protein
MKASSIKKLAYILPVGMHLADKQGQDERETEPYSAAYNL